MQKEENRIFNIIDELWPEQINFMQELISYQSVLLNEFEIINYMKNKLKSIGLFVDTSCIDIGKISNMPAPTFLKKPIQIRLSSFP